MPAKTDAPQCFIFLTIIIGLVFWQISLVLAFVGIFIYTFNVYQSQFYSEYAEKWKKIYALSPCMYGNKYGLMQNLNVEGNKIILTIQPIRALLPGSSEASGTFTARIIDGSLPPSIRQLFKIHSIQILQGVSVELSAIQSALKCQDQFNWCVTSMASLASMSDQINYALSIATGNPLLEPSIPSMEIARARITDESCRITKAKGFSLKTLNDLIGYLSIPEELRQPSTLSGLDALITIRHEDLRSSFSELVEFNTEYVKLIR